MKNKNFTHTAMFFLLLAVLVTGLTSSAAAQSTYPDLTVWDGTWKSSYAYLDDDAMDTAYETIASALPNYSAGNVETVLRSMLATDLSSITILNIANIVGDGTIFGVSIDAADAVGYTYKGVQEVEWATGVSFSWYKFEKTDAADDDPYKYIIGTAAHQDSADSMLHWHMRYGSEGFEALIETAEFWWPTLVQSGLSAEELADEYAAMADEFAQMFPSTPASVPVPGTALLMCSGLIALFRFRARRK